MARPLSTACYGDDLRGARYFVFMLLLSSLPVGCVLPLGEVVRSVAQASSSGLGALGTGSATVGGGDPAGASAGQVGGGAPGSANPEHNGAAGTGNPGVNAVGTTAIPSNNPASGLENAPTTGGVIGGSTGAPPNTGSVGARRHRFRVNRSRTTPSVSKRLKALRRNRRPPQSAWRNLARTVFRPRSSRHSAHETEGATTCVGLPARR
jgi:hypothetical protein